MPLNGPETVSNLPLSNLSLRLDAIKDEFPPKGCAMSHIKALKRAKARGWKNVMIVAARREGGVEGKSMEKEGHNLH